MSLVLRLLALLGVVLTAACQFTAPAPKLTEPPPAPAPPLSTISASLVIPAGEIARILDKKTANHIADVRDTPIKCAIGRCKLTLYATREGPIEARASSGSLGLSVPFGIDAELSLPGFLSSVHAKGNAEGMAETDTVARLSRQWDLETDTLAHVTLSDSRIRIGPVAGDLTDMLNNNEEVLSRPLARAIDRELDESVHLASQVERIWERAFVPIQVGKKPIAWLVLAPERLRVRGPSTENGALALTLGLEVRAQVVTQDEAPSTTASPLPPPAPFRGQANRFTFAVPAAISYADAAKLALNSLTEKPVNVSGMSLRVSKLEILPSHDDVVVAASVCIDQGWWDFADLFAACGSGYLRGTPVFDAASETIRIENLHYDILTANAFLAAMHTLAGPEFGNALESHLVFALSHDLQKLREQVAAALAKPQGRDVAISGKIDSFGAPKLTWTKDGFLALFSAQGHVHTDLHV